MLTKNYTDQQPIFGSPELWLEHYDDAVANGRPPWPPWSRDELLLADREGLFELNQQWIPGKQGLRMLGLPSWFGRRLRPRGELFQEQFLQTMIDVADFTATMKRLQGAV